MQDTQKRPWGLAPDGLLFACLCNLYISAWLEPTRKEAHSQIMIIITNFAPIRQWAKKLCNKLTQYQFLCLFDLFPISKQPYNPNIYIFQCH